MEVDIEMDTVSHAAYPSDWSSHGVTEFDCMWVLGAADLYFPGRF